MRWLWRQLPVRTAVYTATCAMFVVVVVVLYLALYR